MQWLNAIIEKIEKERPDGEIIVSSGVSPSGTYHLGTLREVLTAEAIARELKIRGRKSRHIHVVDDLDVFRKVPVDVEDSFSKYLGMPLCDVPSPDGSDKSYADYFLADLLLASKDLNLEMEVVRAHQKYREGFFVPAIEKSLDHLVEIRAIIEKVSHRKLDENWSPVQIMEDGYLKTRKFVSLDKDKKQIIYLDKDEKQQVVEYDKGEVKLSWRIDWPSRWWLMGVGVEPFGRDHATKGGSYDTGKEIVKQVFGAEAPLPVPYHFINRTGETKKMSKSTGDTITASQLLTVLPAEIVWYFLLKMSPDRQLFFDEGATLIRLFDEFSELSAKSDKTAQEEQLLALCTYGVSEQTVSTVPFSHLVACYQASLRDPSKTLDLISKTEHKKTSDQQKDVIIRELKFIDAWLDHWAPEDIKFSLQDSVNELAFTNAQKEFMQKLADKIENAPDDADGNWYHEAIYELKDEFGMTPKELFSTLYTALIGKQSGPRAGWFLSILPKDWLVSRLRLKR